MAETPKEQSGGLTFDVILKPAVVENMPILKAVCTPTKELSREIIEKKLKEADERRMVYEVRKLTPVVKDRERVQEASHRIHELKDSFSKEVEKKLAEKMVATQENKMAQINALIDRLQDHALRVDEVRKVGEQHRIVLKERIDRKLETAVEKREKQLILTQDRLRKHKMYIDKVIEASSKFSNDTEERLIQKMEATLKNREEYLNNLLVRLKDHDRKSDEVRKNKLNQSSSESVDNMNDSMMDSLSL